MVNYDLSLGKVLFHILVVIAVIGTWLYSTKMTLHKNYAPKAVYIDGVRCIVVSGGGHWQQKSISCDWGNKELEVTEQ